MRYVVAVAIILLTILHQDFWWRADDKTLVFGFLPISLAYHCGVSVAASVLWGLACVYCWPRNLEDEAPLAHGAERGGSSRANRGRGE